jgi:collagenase-like PrtC family protease
MSTMRLALGPVQYAWPRRALFDFYEGIAAAPVDVVYLGEVVCTRRRELSRQDWLDLAAGLASAGKEVVLSTLALMEAEAELKSIEKIAENGRFLVEANDMAAVSILSRRGLAFVAGPHLNVYNAATLEMLARLGACRWVPPLELPRASLAQTLGRCAAQIETELFILGRMPLAFSARCFTARRLGLEKDNCDVACGRHPDGLALSTRDGIQTQSFAACNLAAEIPDLRALGVRAVRVSPQSRRCREMLALVRNVLDKALTASEAAEEIDLLLPGKPCNGFWYGRAGVAQVAA